jgi:hypothetical protein
MGLGVISANISTKVSAAVDAVGTTTSTLYTCPANSYAILNAVISAGGSGASITVAGNTILSTAFGDRQMTIYVGPAQAVACTATGGAEVSISGVEFINSP